MAEAKTQPTTASVAEFIEGVADAERRRDCETIVAMMERVTGRPAVMWGDAIVGFGRYRLTYANGKTADWPVAAFSPRKSDLTLYISSDLDGYESLIANVGKVKHSKACVYVKRLRDLDVDALETLVRRGVEHMQPTRVE